MLNNLFVRGSPPKYSEETIDILRLIRSENVGSKTSLRLIDLFGSAKLALENIEEFSLRGGKSKPIKIYSRAHAEKELEQLAKNKAAILILTNSRKVVSFERIKKEVYNVKRIDKCGKRKV